MKNEVIPPDQFSRVTDEMTKLTRVFEEIQKGINMASRMPAFNAQRALEKARTDIETAGYWMSRALQHLQEETKL